MRLTTTNLPALLAAAFLLTSPSAAALLHDSPNPRQHHVDKRQVQFQTVFPTTTVPSPSPTCTRPPLESSNPLNQPFFAIYYDRLQFRTACPLTGSSGTSGPLYFGCLYLCGSDPSLLDQYPFIPPSNYKYCVNDNSSISAGPGPVVTYTYPNGNKKACIRCPAQALPSGPVPRPAPAPGVAFLSGFVLRGTCGTEMSRVQATCPFLCDLSYYEYTRLGIGPGSRHCVGRGAVQYNSTDKSWYLETLLYGQFRERVPCTPCPRDCGLLEGGKGGV